jgi:hypothetical protein
MVERAPSLILESCGCPHSLHRKAWGECIESIGTIENMKVYILRLNRISCVILLSLFASTLACQWPAEWNEWGAKKDTSRHNSPMPVTGPSGDKTPTVTIVSEDERSDIIQVINFIPTNPWLIFDPLDGKVDGFKCTVYLAAPLQGERSGTKGFFGDGTIIIQMFQGGGDDSENSRMELVHTWELPPEEAAKWRAKKMTVLGWGYGLRLRWPETVTAGGHKVSFLVSYRRSDGRLISSSRPIVRRVPLRGV